MKTLPAFLAPLLLAGCLQDETISGYAETGQSYWLQSINGKAFDADASIRFDGEGTVSGAAPCNSYSAGQLAPYPWFELGPMRVSRAACDRMADEVRFLNALQRMTVAEVSGPVLVLSNPDGEAMVFDLRREGG